MLMHMEEAQRMSTVSAMEGSKSRILLVDDDPAVAWSLGKYLTRIGLSVVTSGDGEEALQLLQREHFDALVTDIQMPRLNGLALIEWVRQHRPDLAVVAITGFGSASVQDVALRRGAVLYLEKPVDPSLLAEILKSDDSADTFSGTIHDIDLLEYVQMLLISRKQTVLEVSGREGVRAHLYVDRGDIIHAELGAERGEQAFRKCLELEGGTFKTQPWREPEQRTIDLSGDYLLMEAARQMDEQRAARDSNVLGNEPEDQRREGIDTDIFEKSFDTSFLEFMLTDDDVGPNKG
jgi:CheY-like chemotaxis protein